MTDEKPKDPRTFRKMVGRPTLLEPERIKRIVQAISAGNYIETAAAYAGITKSSLFKWLRRGAQERDRCENGGRARIREAPFREFVILVEKAMADSETRDVALIATAAATQWQAAAWRLERKYPHRWGRRERLEHSGPGGGPIEVESVVVIGGDEEEYVKGMREARRMDSKTQAALPAKTDEGEFPES